MSMVGGIQPGRLRSYLVDALEDGPSNDGLIQRFQLLVWPDTAPDWNYVDRAPDAASEESAARVFRKLVELDAEKPDAAPLRTRRTGTLRRLACRTSKRGFEGMNSIRLSFRT